MPSSSLSAAREEAAGSEVTEIRHAITIRIARKVGARLAGIHQRVPIGVDETRFDDVGDAVVVGVQVAHVRNPVTIGIGERGRRALERIEDAVVIGIDIRDVRSAIAIGVTKIACVRDAVLVDVAAAQ